MLFNDYEMWFRIASRFDVGFLDIWDTNYRIHNAQATHPEQARLGEHRLALLGELDQWLPDDFPPLERRRARSGAHLRAAYDAFARREVRRAPANSRARSGNIPLRSSIPPCSMWRSAHGDSRPNSADCGKPGTTFDQWKVAGVSYRESVIAIEGKAGHRGILGATACRFCGAPLELTSSTWACRRSARPSSDRRSSSGGARSTRSTCASVSDAGSCSSRPSCRQRRSSREYAYFSAFSTSWVEHARRYVETMIERFGLGARQPRRRARVERRLPAPALRRSGHPVLGIEPARTSPRPPCERGVATLVEFFGSSSRERLVAEGGRADLIVGNNVLAQVPDLNDFVGGIAVLLAPDGTATFEFPHLAAADRGAPVRHDLPRALLVLLARRRSTQIFARARPRGLRRRGAADPRRLAPRLRRARRGGREPSRRASPRCSRARSEPGCALAEGYRALRRRASRESKRRCSSC